MTLWKSEFFLPYNFFFFLGGGPSAYSGRYAEVLCLLTSWLLLLILQFEFLGTAVDLGYCLKSLQSSFKIIDILSNIHFPFRF